MGDDDRALAGVRYRRAPSPAVEYVSDEPSGAIEDPDARRVVRSRRTTKARLEKLEEKVDTQVSVTTEIRVDVAGMRGELKSFLTTLSESNRTERVRIGTRAKVIVAVVGAVSAIAGAVIAAMAGCA